MDERDGISRLTGREKECLRLWLEHKTAKEIALDLGISHHAVEKRLKMARTKLDVGSSLEAARMLGEAEGYGQTVAGAPEMVAAGGRGQGWNSRTIAMGVIAMSLIATTALVLLTQGAATSQAGWSSEANPSGEIVQPTEAQIATVTRATFEYLDEDESGYLEGLESPVMPPRERQPVLAPDGNGNMVETGETRIVTPREVTKGFYDMADTDGDGRVDYAEFRQWATPNLMRSGIPAEMAESLDRNAASDS